MNNFYAPPVFLDHLYPEIPYHNRQHSAGFDYSACPTKDAMNAAWFHDACYDPLSASNEANAVAEYKKVRKYWSQSHFGNCFSGANIEKVEALILSTRDHVKSFDRNDNEMVWLHKNDLAYLRETNRAKIVETEKKIFKEYQFAPFNEYREKRITILEYYKGHVFTDNKTVDKIINFLLGWTPKIGVFAGSFNPMHVGHYDIIRQAEAVFDKVIIAQGQNEEKENNAFDLSKLETIRYHEKEKYDGSLFDYLRKKQKELRDVSLIRGLRNNDDLEHENALFSFQQDFTSVPSVYFIAKNEYRHVSSGAIRKLQNLGKDVSKYLIK